MRVSSWISGVDAFDMWPFYRGPLAPPCEISWEYSPLISHCTLDLVGC